MLLRLQLDLACQVWHLWRRVSLDADELDVKDERRSAGNLATGAPIAIPERGRDGELSLLADAHVEQALVPALDDLAGAEREFKFLVAVVRRVKLFSRALEVSPVRSVVFCRLEGIRPTCSASSGRLLFVSF